VRYKTQNRRKKERENRKASRHDREENTARPAEEGSERGVMTKIKLMSGGHESDGFEMTAGI